MITIYGLFSTKDGVVRYIGQCKCTPKERLKAHLRDSIKMNKSHKCNWIRKVLADGCQIGFTVLKENAVWNEDEIAFIKHYKNQGFDLVNNTIGGDGAIGAKWSAEAKKKLSESKQGWKNSPESIEKMRTAAIGRKHTDETKKKLSNKNLGRASWNKNKILPNFHKQETKIAISQKLKGVKKTKEHRENIRVSWIKRKQNLIKIA